MVTDKEADAHAERMYNAERRRVHRQMIPPIIFFVVLAAVILASVLGYRHNQREGIVEPEGDAIIVNYMCVPLGSVIYENVDPIDTSYGDYIYIGSEFYEVRVQYAFEIYDHIGTSVWDGTDTAETMIFTSVEDDPATQEEVDAMAENLTTAFGAYEETDGIYVWYEDEDGKMGDNDNLARVTLGLNDDGTFYIEAEAN